MRTKIALFVLFAGVIAFAAFSAAAEEVAPASPKPPNTWESGKFSLIPRGLQANPRLDIMIVTELTSAGRLAPPASADHPVYYTGSDGGMVTVGQAISGEQPPPSSELAQILVKALVASGFLPADREHPPEIYIHYRWGSFNRLPRLPGGPDELDQLNLFERAALVGGTQFAVDMAEAMYDGTFSFFQDSSSRNNFLVQETLNNQYFIVATAYDFQAATQGKVVPLWHTKISTSSRGIMMDESLPQMVASAAPFFGHETDGPVRLNRPAVKGQVEIGVPTVKEYLTPDQPAGPDSPPAGH